MRAWQKTRTCPEMRVGPGMKIQVFATVVALSACNASRVPASGQTLARPTPIASNEVSAVDSPRAGRQCEQLGYAEAFTPTLAQRRANARALQLHRERRSTEAAEIWSGLLETTPAYTLARYNRACAFAKLSAQQQAFEELKQVYCEDYPTFASKATNDDDLVALRPALSRLGGQIEAEYRAAHATSDSVILRGTFNSEEGESRWAQAARYTDQRFVPVAPRTVHTGPRTSTPPLITAMETEAGIVTVSSSASDADDPSLIVGGVEIVLTEPVTGIELARWRTPGRRHHVPGRGDGAAAERYS